VSPRVLATVTIAPSHPRPLTQREMDWIADLLSLFACEYLKGEHRGTESLAILEPPESFVRSMAQ
jgi:hypothetical protein